MPTSHLGIVRFYGPKRNDKGHLWGFLELFGTGGQSEDVYVAEPAVKEDIREGQIVVFEITVNPRTKKLQAQFVRPLSTNVEDCRVLLDTIVAIGDAGGNVPTTLSNFLGKIDASIVPDNLVQYLPPQVIAERAASDEPGLLKLLKQTEKRNVSPAWLRNWIPPKHGLSTRTVLAAIQILCGIEAEGESEVIPRIWSSLTDEQKHSVVDADADLVARRIVPRLDYQAIMSSPLLVGLLSPEDLSLLVRRSLHDKWSYDLLGRTVTTERLSEMAKAELERSTDKVLHVDFNVAKELSALAHLMEPGLRLELGMWVSSTDHPLAGEHRQHLEGLATSHGVPRPDIDRQRLRVVTARILLSLPVDRAVHLAQTRRLQGEFTHLLTCIDKRGAPLDPDSCLGSPDPLGHAVGHAIARSVVGHAAVAPRNDDRQHIARLLCAALTPDHPETPMDEEDIYYKVLNEWVLHLLVSGTFSSHAGELRQLLPRCSENVVSFCEGKPASEGFEHPYCPRLNKGCSSALVAPSQSPQSSEWNIIDLLASPGTSTRHDLHGRTLANTIAGWANRYHEMSERLSCTGCGGKLKVNFEFSRKFDARYATTRGTCSNACGAYDVYLNHCFNCNEIIDNRESPYFVSDTGQGMTLIDTGGDPDRTSGKGLYLCIHCANRGLLWCPKCGSPQAEMRGFGESRRCTECSHTVSANPRGSLLRLRTKVMESSDADVPRTPTSRPYVHESWEGTRRKMALEIMLGSRYDGF